MAVTRLDQGTVRGVEPTPQGGVRVTAALTRTGVLRYRDTAGREWAEYRPPDEVFAADSLATLRGAPVTDLHPPALLDAASWRQHAVGHVGDDVRADGGFVVATLTVQDAAEVARITARERREVSCGYRCDLDPTPGVTPAGEAYDAVQKNITYNHAALGPQGWGRAGADVCLRLDGAAIEVRPDDGPSPRPPPPPPTARADARGEGAPMSKKLKVRGREYRLDDDAALAEAQDAVVSTETDADALKASLDATQGALTDALTQLAQAQAKLAAMTAAEAAEEDDEAAMEAALDAREALREAARRVLGPDAPLRGTRPAELKRAVVAKALPTVKLDAVSAEALEGMFTAVTTAAAARNDALGQVRQAAEGAARADAADPEDPMEAMRRRSAEAWKQPTSLTARRGA